MSNKMVASLVKDIRKQFGEDAVYPASEIPSRGGITSGSLAFDYAIGPMGGLPRDRCIEFFGPESSGKTTLGLLAIAQFLDAQPQRAALILDLEHKLDLDRMTALLGSRMERVIVTFPDYIEEAQDIYTMPVAVPSGDIAITLLDSIGGAPNKSMTERSATEVDYGNAKMVTRFGKIAQGHSHKYECATIGINQIRDNFNPNDHSINTPGGKGWKHNCSLRVYLRKGKGRQNMSIAGETVVVGHTVAGRIYKNHLGGIEGREFSYWIYNVPTAEYGFGVDQGEETSRLSVATGVVQRNGGWLYHDALPGGKINGQYALTALMRVDAEARVKIAAQTIEALREADNAATVVAPSEMIEPDPDEPPQLGRNPLKAGLL